MLVYIGYTVMYTWIRKVYCVKKRVLLCTIKKHEYYKVMVVTVYYYYN